jgi:hypothetical protein
MQNFMILNWILHRFCAPQNCPLPAVTLGQTLSDQTLSVGAIFGTAEAFITNTGTNIERPDAQCLCNIWHGRGLHYKHWDKHWATRRSVFVQYLARLRPSLQTLGQTLSDQALSVCAIFGTAEAFITNTGTNIERPDAQCLCNIWHGWGLHYKHWDKHWATRRSVFVQYLAQAGPFNPHNVIL